MKRWRGAFDAKLCFKTNFMHVLLSWFLSLFYIRCEDMFWNQCCFYEFLDSLRLFPFYLIIFNENPDRIRCLLSIEYDDVNENCFCFVLILDVLIGWVVSCKQLLYYCTVYVGFLIMCIINRRLSFFTEHRKIKLLSLLDLC